MVEHGQQRAMPSAMHAFDQFKAPLRCVIKRHEFGGFIHAQAIDMRKGLHACFAQITHHRACRADCGFLLLRPKAIEVVNL